MKICVYGQQSRNETADAAPDSGNLLSNFEIK